MKLRSVFLAAVLSVTCVKSALGAPSKEAIAAHEEGLAFAKKGQFPRAIDALHRAVKLDPEFAEAWADLGNFELALGNLTPAVTAFEQAVKIRPEFQIARYNLAYSLRKSKEFDRATEQYRLYLQHDPQDADAHYGLAESLRARGSSLAAAEAYEEYARVEKRPEQGKWIDKAKSLAKSLRADAEKEAASKPPILPASAASSPPAPAPSAARGATDLEIGSRSERTMSKSASSSSDPKRAPKPAGARPNGFDAALLGLKQGDFKGALAPLTDAAKRAPEDPLVLAALASAHLGLRQGKEAEVAYRRALKHASKEGLSGIYFGLGEALRLQGEEKEAREAYRTASSQESASVEIKKLAEERLRALR